MKKVMSFLTHAVTIFVMMGGAIYVLSALIREFPVIWRISNSPFFTTIITFLVGLTAYIVYVKQKEDQKRAISILIVQEIRYAENRIREARERGHDYLLKNKLLPTNSWHKNIHLFISSLSETDTDTIGRFYSTVEYLDSLIEKISNEMTFPRNYEQNMPSTQLALNILQKVSGEVELIYNSPAVDVLRKISN